LAEGVHQVLDQAPVPRAFEQERGDDRGRLGQVELEARSLRSVASFAAV
jgi:hypothetical protein